MIAAVDLPPFVAVAVAHDLGFDDEASVVTGTSTLLLHKKALDTA